ELMAGVPECFRGFLLPKPKYRKPFFTDTHGQTREITVAGHEAEAIKLPRIQQIHGVNYQRTVRGILAGGVSVLLDWFDGVLLQYLPPGRAVGRREIAINPLDGGLTESGNLSQQALDDGSLGVVGVDQDCQPSCRVFGFDFCDEAGVYHACISNEPGYQVL